MKAKHLKWKTEPYVDAKAVVRKIRFYNFKIFINYFIASLLGGLAFFILYTCITSGNDTQKMNECLKTHDLNYCNNNVR